MATLPSYDRAIAGGVPNVYGLYRSVPRIRPVKVQAAANSGLNGCSVGLAAFPTPGNILIATSSSIESGAATVVGFGVKTWNLIATATYASGAQIRASAWWGIVSSTPGRFGTFTYTNSGDGLVIELSGLTGVQQGSAVSNAGGGSISLDNLVSAAMGAQLLYFCATRGTVSVPTGFTVVASNNYVNAPGQVGMLSGDRYTPGSNYALAFTSSGNQAAMAAILT